MSEFASRERRTVTLSDGARAALNFHGWPGNVRELRNVLEVCVALSDDAVITRDHVCAALRRDVAHTPDEQGLEAALRRNRWHRGRTAQHLGVSRTTLWRRMKAEERESS